MHQDYAALKQQIDDAIEAYTSDIKKVVWDESRFYTLNIELNKLIYLKGGPKEGGEVFDRERPLDDRLSIIEKAFAIQDITNEYPNVSRITHENYNNNALNKYDRYERYEKSPQKIQTTNMSMYNFSESKIREQIGKGNKGKKNMLKQVE